MFMDVVNVAIVVIFDVVNGVVVNLNVMNFMNEVDVVVDASAL